MIRLLWLVLLTAFAAYGSALTLNGEEKYSVQGHLYYFEDVNGSVPFSDVSKQPFSLSKQESANFGFTESVYWFRIDLARDIQAAQKRWWLMVAYPLLEHVDVYLSDKEGNLISHSQVGLAVPFGARELPLREFVTELSLRGSSETTLYVRVQTQSSMQVPLSIHSSESLFHDIEENNFALGIYYGLFLIIMVYNGGIFFYTKDRNYLRYIIFLSSLVLWQISFDGIGKEYFWPQNEWMIHHGPSFWIAMSAFSALYFSRNFLHTSQYVPKMDRLIRWLMGISLVLVMASVFLPYGEVIRYNAALASILPLVLLIAGILVMRQGYRPARLYVAGWSSFLVGTIVFAFHKFDLIPGFDGVNHVQQLGSAIEMIFLSWALADRVHLLQKEYVDKLNHLNETLTEKVNNALTEVRKKDQLFVQQSRLAALGEMIEQIAHQWRQPLNTLALINQDLYIKYKLGQCDEHCFERSHEQFDEHLQYMSKTIDDFRNFYKSDKSKQIQDVGDLAADALRLSDVFLKYAKIKTSLECSGMLKVSIAKNEMIQVLLNMIKNAHDAIVQKKTANGHIAISVDDFEEYVRVIIEDDGGGISPEIMDQIFAIYFTTKDPEYGTGLGLHMSKYIVEESFGGKIWVENIPGGARFVILIPSENLLETLAAKSE